ncbi:hypothetical protein STEG23_010517 [Scotinomys teguina]
MPKRALSKAKQREDYDACNLSSSEKENTETIKDADAVVVLMLMSTLQLNDGGFGDPREASPYPLQKDPPNL